MAKKSAEKKVKKGKQLAITDKPAATKKSSAKFVSFTVTATIPVQSYGNIQPKIEVVADSYEEARAFAMPLIEQLYAHYGESKPAFLGKVVVTEKVVTPTQGPAPVATPAAPTPAQVAAQAGHTSTPDATASTAKPKSEAVQKAEKAIKNAVTEDAMLLIQGQIEKSTKIAAEDKPALLTLCLQRRGEISK